MEAIQQAVEIRIDNPPEQLREYLQATLVPVDFADGLKLGDYVKQAERGVYLLLTKSTSEGIHVSLLLNGELKYSSPWILSESFWVCTKFSKALTDDLSASACGELKRRSDARQTRIENDSPQEVCSKDHRCTDLQCLTSPASVAEST